VRERVAERLAALREADERHVQTLESTTADAEHLISAWEREAETRGLDRYSRRFWDEAEGWFAAQRQRT
jgi:hypothetical protein